MSSKKKILFLVPYPVGHAPSQRFRVELFEPYLREAGISYTIAPFMDKHTWNVLYKQGSALQKAWGIVKGYLKRWKTVLIDIHNYEYVFVHREAAPLGPPVFEWVVARLWRKKMLYDFDDAIWIPNTSAENKLASWLKGFGKVKHICKWAHTVVCGNDYLCNFARKYNDNVVLIPTCVDMERMHKGFKQHTEGSVVVGWTGSHSTLHYLNAIVPVLQKLEHQYDSSFLVIANKNPQLPLKNFTFKHWSAATEINDLLLMDIGVMPLAPDAWSEGKCGFKLIQYLSLGIPAVASPVGVNKVIVEEDVNGYLAESDSDWEEKLTALIKDAGLRKRMGAAGHQKMQAEYSIASQYKKFLSLFN